MNEELDRLMSGQSTAGNSQMLWECIVVSDIPSQTVLANIRQVLQPVLKYGVKDHADHAFWLAHLPPFFTDACSPEMTEEEKVRYISLPFEERMKWADRWSLSAWLFWFTEKERQWFWWDGQIEDIHTLKIKLDAAEYPYGLESFAWLVKTCGGHWERGAKKGSVNNF